MIGINAKTLFIVNPRAGNGAAGRQWPEMELLAEKFFSEHQALVTDAPGRAGEFARQAVKARVEKVVCVGGDGTLNEVINGLMAVEVPRKARPQLGYLPFGTGCDLARTLGISKNHENGLRNIANREGRWLDLGRATFVDHSGATISRYFVNVLSFGLGGEVSGRTNRSSKVLGGFLSFLVPTLQALFYYKAPRLHLVIDDIFDKELTCLQVAVANGQYHGGGMRIAPDARVDDGSFRVTVVGDLGKGEVIMNLPKLYDGRIYTVPGVSGFSGRRIEATAREEVLIDVDGEQPGRLPLQVEILPRILWMIT